MEGKELCVPGRIPLADGEEHRDEGTGIGKKVISENRLEQGGSYPFEAPQSASTIKLICGLGRISEVPVRAERVRAGRFLQGLIITGFFKEIGPPNLGVFILIIDADIEKPGILGADRQWQVVVDSVEEHVVAKRVPLKRLKEDLPRTFQPLEEVGAAESHEPLSGAREVGQGTLLIRGRRFVWLRRDVVSKPVARKLQRVDRIHNTI